MRRNLLISRERTAGVLGDRQPYAAGKFPFFPIDLRRRVAGAARCEAHRQHAVVRCTEPFPFDPRDVIEIRGLLRLLLQIAAVAVRKTRANAGVAERAQIGVGISAGDNVVGPVMNCRQPGIDRLRDAKPRAVVSVFRRHHGSEPAHYGKIIESHRRRRRRARSCPKDENECRRSRAERCDCGRRFLRLPVRASSGPTAIRAPLRTCTSPTGYVAQFCIHRDEIGVAHDKIAARRKFSRFAVRGRHSRGLLRAGCAGGYAE